MSAFRHRKYAMNTTRPAAVAGSFYPGDARTLRATLASHLAGLPTHPDATHPPKLLVLPHAGYVYSGDVAARGYAELTPWRERIRRVLLLGPVHRVPVRGLAAPTVESFETPLGRVRIDREAIASLSGLRQLVLSDRPHAPEHSLEVQLPFLQTVLGDGFGLVPLAVGDSTPAEVAEVLERLWGGDETVLIVSSDLSHYLPDEAARARDGATLQRILHFATDLQGDEACGAAPLNGALQLARQKGLVPRLLAQRTSADARQGQAGRDRVVGYGALAFDLPPEVPFVEPPPDEAVGAVLLAHARHAIARTLELPEGDADLPSPPSLAAPGATFVTLRDDAGELRGCVGRLEASRPLLDDVRANAVAAAFHDGRFPPVHANEWRGLQVEVSLLDPPQLLPPHETATEALAQQALRPGEDGVILSWQGRRATFLPQVWEQLPDPRAFLAALKRKAGLAPDFWAPDVQLSRYRVRKFVEPAR
jgi:MEMO1 family protein